MSENKILLITHKADLDGGFPIILGKLTYSNIETISIELNQVDETLKSNLERINEFDKIYIVDLNISEELAEELDKNEIVKSKLEIFDHHLSAIKLNKYSFINVIDINEYGKKESGTSLFYKHLLKTVPNNYLEKNSTKELVNLVRLIDTWEWEKENNQDAVKLGNLYSIYGREKFIEKFYKYILNNETFEFSETDKTLLEIETRNINEYVEDKLKNIIFATLDNIKVGIVFAERNRSVIGHTMAEKYIDKIDIAIIINITRSISYRASSNNDVDINILAIPNKGGGHKKAGGSPLPEHLLEDITKLIFKDVVIEGE